MADEAYPPPQGWRERSACIGTPIDWWFPVDGAGHYYGDVVPIEAEALCARCHVREACYEDSLRVDRYGVRAGMHEDRRHQMRRQRRIRLREEPDLVAVERAVAAARAAAEIDDDTRTA